MLDCRIALPHSSRRWRATKRMLGKHRPRWTDCWRSSGRWRMRRTTRIARSMSWRGINTHVPQLLLFLYKTKIIVFIKRKIHDFFYQIIFQLGSYQKECFFVNCNSIFGFFGNLTHLSSYVHEMRIHLNVKCVISVALFLQFGLV